ncbi:MAG: hypothetical protein HUJ25_13545 [Crocinitomicaceae bacterium]|nr:hypothetical protein [Crocinitomicaceae bacterium]
MSSNEYIDQETVDQQQIEDSKKSRKRRTRKKRANKNNGRLVVQIMNGEFLSRDWFVRNLPFTFYIGFLLVVLIGWGYYGETTSKKEVLLQEELSELNSEYFTLSSEYISKRGRIHIKEKLNGTGLQESTVSPRKIRVRRYVFE